MEGILRSTAISFKHLNYNGHVIYWYIFASKKTQQILSFSLCIQNQASLICHVCLLRVLLRVFQANYVKAKSNCFLLLCFCKNVHWNQMNVDDWHMTGDTTSNFETFGTDAYCCRAGYRTGLSALHFSWAAILALSCKLTPGAGMQLALPYICYCIQQEYSVL